MLSRDCCDIRQTLNSTPVPSRPHTMSIGRYNTSIPRMWTNLGKTRKESGRDPFNQNSNRPDREKWSTSKGGPVFSKLFLLDRSDPLSLNGFRPASYPDVSLLMKLRAQRKARRRQWASPAVCTLPMVPCGSSPVTCFALASAMRKTKRLRRRLGP